MPRLSPEQHYAADLQTPGFIADPAQAQAVARLQHIYQELLDTPPRRSRWGKPSWTPVQGAYLWGGVGRGKTYLMDCFYDALPFGRKRRTHFHRFMQDVHDRYKAYADTSDPLTPIADELATEARVLCFDEFFVSDVADAMILARLLETLFERGITLLATSNIPPDQLYLGGLQRARFLPAIASIQQRCQVLQIDGDTDYRLRVLQQAEIYHYPLDATADQNLDRYFTEIAPDHGLEETSLQVHGREIPTRRLGDGVVWFDFADICGGPRAAADYIEIARCYGTVLLSNVPCLDWTLENEARRFLHLVDEFYDRRVKLIVSAAVPLTDLYAGRKLVFEYDRVRSRLREMQSVEYLALAHRP